MDLSYLPEITFLTIFIVGFRPLVRKVGSHADLWFLGWGFVLLHDVAMALGGGGVGEGHMPARLLAIWSLDLCAVTFLVVAANVPKACLTRALIVEIGGAALVVSALYASDAGTAGVRAGACGLFLLPAIHLVVSAKDRSRPLTVLSVLFAAFGAGLFRLRCVRRDWCRGLCFRCCF